MSEIPLLPDHGSYTFFQRLFLCERQWVGHYIERLPEPVTGMMLLGSTVHQVLDELHRGTTAPDDGPDRFADLFVTLAVPSRDGRSIDPRDIDWGYRDLSKAERRANTLLDRGMRLIRDYLPYLNRNRPYIRDGEPLSEYRLSIDLTPYGGRRVRHLVMVLDLFTADGRLIDFKVRDRTPISRDHFRTDLQPLIYAFGLVELGIADPPIPFRYGQFIDTYDESVGGRIPAWRIDAFREAVLPGLVANAESVLDRMAAAPDPLAAAAIRPGGHCRTCFVRARCPLFSRSEPDGSGGSS